MVRGLLPGCLTGKRDASRNPLKCSQNLTSSRLRLVRLVDLGWIWLIWWIGLIRVNPVITGGLQRNLNCALLMFNALMRWSSVDGGTPSFAAAPDEPPTRPRHTASTASMVSRSLRGAP